MHRFYNIYISDLNCLNHDFFPTLDSVNCAISRLLINLHGNMGPTLAFALSRFKNMMLLLAHELTTVVIVCSLLAATVK